MVIVYLKVIWQESNNAKEEIKRECKRPKLAFLVRTKLENIFSSKSGATVTQLNQGDFSYFLKGLVYSIGASKYIVLKVMKG